MHIERDQDGFTLIELMVVVMVIAILIAIAIPSFLGARTRAQDRAAQQMLVNGAKVEATWESDNSGYTDDASDLHEEEPALDWTGSDPDSVHIVLAGDASEVLLYSRSNSGTWFGIRLAGGEKFTCSGSVETDVDELTDCTGIDW